VQPPAPTWIPTRPQATRQGPLCRKTHLPDGRPDTRVTTMQKFLQHIDFSYDWLPATTGHESSGIWPSTTWSWRTFAFPMFTTRTRRCWCRRVAVPLLGRARIGATTESGRPAPADMPPRTYHLSRTAWNPQITPWLAAELNFRIGLYTDFSRVSGDSFLYTGKGSPDHDFTEREGEAGIWYLDGNKSRCCRPAVFAGRPTRISTRHPLSQSKNRQAAHHLGNTDWWLYAAEITAAAIGPSKRETGVYAPDINGMFDTVDYNDMRFAIGLEFNSHGSFTECLRLAIPSSENLFIRAVCPQAIIRPARCTSAPACRTNLKISTVSRRTGNA